MDELMGSMTTFTTNAQDQAKAQLESIVGMMERLEHAQKCNGDCGKTLKQIAEGLRYTLNNNTNFPNQATDDAWVKEYHDEDAAQQAIQEDPLSVLVRSGWYTPGEALYMAERNSLAGKLAVEYEILLCTGGPAVRIRGTLDNDGQPQDARLEYQDWGTPWIEYTFHLPLRPTLLAYAQQFYYGD